ncbi:MAG: RsmE family RNA methyltransferase, partial [Ignavibacteriae bacterium]|nr:RsmE family RNA methyltransferase [Ignavibacteriota bacterium]
MIFSNTEFYFAEQKNINGKSISIYDEEAKHITSVMRHSIGDDIFVTDGNGNVYKSIIKIITKTKIELTILEKIKINNNLSHVTFYLPILKATDRFEFALEKCVELGITNFKIFSAEKSHTRGIKIERWNKILLAAMKQSLQAHLPIIEFIELKDVNLKSDINIVLEQNSDEKLITYLNTDSFQKEVLK